MTRGNPIITVRLPPTQRVRWETTRQELGYQSLSGFIKAQCEAAARSGRFEGLDAHEIWRLRRALNRAADSLERLNSGAGPSESWNAADVQRLIDDIDQIVRTLNRTLR